MAVAASGYYSDRRAGLPHNGPTLTMIAGLEQSKGLFEEVGPHLRCKVEREEGSACPASLLSCLNTA